MRSDGLQAYDGVQTLVLAHGWSGHEVRLSQVADESIVWDAFDGHDYEVFVYRAVIPEPSALVIWSLLGTLGVTMGWWRRRLGDNRFGVLIPGPSGFRRLLLSATRCATSPPVVSLQEPGDPANQPVVVTAMSACARSWASFSANCPS